MSEPWKRGDQDHDEEDDDDDNWSPLEPSIEEDGTSDSITDVLRKYAAIYNKNGRIGIYTREVRTSRLKSPMFLPSLSCTNNNL